jgi:hypothetical protein
MELVILPLIFYSCYIPIFLLYRNISYGMFELLLFMAVSFSTECVCSQWQIVPLLLVFTGWAS